MNQKVINSVMISICRLRKCLFFVFKRKKTTKIYLYGRINADVATIKYFLENCFD